MEFGTFLLLQSPSARSSQEIFGRGVDIQQAGGVETDSQRSKPPLDGREENYYESRTHLQWR